jgi:hypothetical protein
MPEAAFSLMLAGLTLETALRKLLHIGGREIPESEFHDSPPYSELIRARHSKVAGTHKARREEVALCPHRNTGDMSARLLFFTVHPTTTSRQPRLGLLTAGDTPAAG